MEELSSWICFLSISASSCMVCLSRCSLVVYSTAEMNIQCITRGLYTCTSGTQTTQKEQVTTTQNITIFVIQEIIKQ